jgi:Uncharacterized enzyme involved in biosynthesis of extracellular polysaccharides
MYIIIWEYEVKADHSAEFEKIYGENGTWVELFRNGSGYLGTELLLDSRQLPRYLTIDRWASAVDHEVFLSDWRKEYEKLDAQCEGLTDQETLVGKWETILHETR